MKYSLFIGALLIMTALATPVLADTFVRTADQFELPQGQIIEGNFLGVGHPITVAGEVTEDAILLGNRVTVTGTIDRDLLALGVLANVDGVVEEDVRIVAGNTTVSGTVKGDLLVVAGSVDVLSSAVVEGDVLLYAGVVNLSGSVGGKVIGSARNMNIDGPVGGGVDVHVTELSLGQNASITESVRYTSNNLVNQSLDTIVAGTVLRNDPVLSAQGLSLRSVAMPFVILSFSTLLWLFLSKRTLVATVTQTVNQLPRSAITGTVALFMTPLIVFVLFLSMLGSIVAMIVLVGYLLLLLLAVAALPATIGLLCVKLSNLTETSVSVVTVLIGTTVCGVLLLLPSIGLFVLLFLTSIVFGGLIESVIRASR